MTCIMVLYPLTWWVHSHNLPGSTFHLIPDLLDSFVHLMMHNVVLFSSLIMIIIIIIIIGLCRLYPSYLLKMMFQSLFFHLSTVQTVFSVDGCGQTCQSTITWWLWRVYNNSFKCIWYFTVAIELEVWTQPRKEVGWNCQYYCIINMIMPDFLFVIN